MNYDVDALFQVTSCRVIFVEDRDTANNIEAACLAREPKYRYEQNPAFAYHKKIGPFSFKNKKKLWDILTDTKAVRDVGANAKRDKQETMVAFLRKQTERLELRYAEDRGPIAMPDLQRERASVLYDALNGRNVFLINDFRYENHRSNGYTVTSWARTYEGFAWLGRDVIWITPMTFQELLEKEGEDSIREGTGGLNGCYCFFKGADGKVIPLDKNQLLASCPKAKKTQPATSKLTVQKPRETTADSAPRRQSGRAKSPAQTVLKNNGDFTMGLALLTGNSGLRKDFQKAKYYLLPLAQENDQYAQFYMGEWYADRENPGRDYQQAVEWYRLAADRGVTSAMCRLGLCYFDGLGVAQDRPKARQLLEKSVTTPGSYIGGFRLYYEFASGDFVTRDMEEASYWVMRYRHS